MTIIVTSTVTRKDYMADAKFPIVENGVLKNPIHRACRAAVVYPAAGRGRAADQDELQKVYDRLQRKWRIRLTMLRQAGWNFMNGGSNPDKHFTFVRNCPPIGIVTTNPTTYARCKRSKVCPNCYARQVVVPACAAFEVLIPALTPEQRAKMSLVAFQRTIRREVSRWPIEKAISGLKMKNQQVVETNTVRPQPLGAVVFTNLALNDDGDHWVFRRSGVVVVDSPNATIEFPGSDVSHSVRHVKNLNLKNACAAVGWAAKYPKTWLHAPIEPSVAMLNALEKSRFNQIRFHGALRNGPMRRLKEKEILERRRAKNQN